LKKSTAEAIEEVDKIALQSLLVLHKRPATEASIKETLEFALRMRTVLLEQMPQGAAVALPASADEKEKADLPISAGGRLPDAMVSPPAPPALPEKLPGGIIKPVSIYQVERLDEVSKKLKDEEPKALPEGEEPDIAGGEDDNSGGFNRG
jgi:hypothetical protein